MKSARLKLKTTEDRLRCKQRSKEEIPFLNRDSALLRNTSRANESLPASARAAFLCWAGPEWKLTLPCFRRKVEASRASAALIHDNRVGGGPMSFRLSPSFRPKALLIGSAFLSGLASLALAGPAAAESVRKDCSVKYQAAKAAGTLNGLAWPQFYSQCAAEAKTAAPGAAPAASPAATPAATPAAPPPPQLRSQRPPLRLRHRQLLQPPVRLSFRPPFPLRTQARRRAKRAGRPVSISTTPTRRPTQTAD